MKAIAVGALALVVASALAGPAMAQSSTFLSANLQGQDVPGGKGDDKAGANFNGEIKPRTSEVCYYLDMDGLDDASAVYIRSSKEKEPEPAPAPDPAPAVDAAAADPAAVVDPAAAPPEPVAAPPPAPIPTLALRVPGPDGDEVCVRGDKDMLAQIAAAPADFYVEIATPGHPDGAVRGALKR